MASDYTYDLTPPRRPSLDDLGGAAKRDDAAFPPNPLTMPTAQNWNQFARLDEGRGKFDIFITFEIRFNAGAPYIASVRSMRSSLTTASFAAPTDNGAGDTTISWAPIAASFPPKNREPGVELIGDGDYRVPTTDTTTANTVRVRTRDGTGALVDAPFYVHVYGT